MILSSCQKAIKIDLPEVDQDYVVEGRIETGTPPIVILSQTQGYFEEASAESIFGTFVHNADITMTNSNGENFSLIEICSSSIPDSLYDEISLLTGIPEESLAVIDFCIYTSIDGNALGVIGQTYSLEIKVGDVTMTSSTTIPYPVYLDSTWFEVETELDSLGFLWATLTDPDTVGNCYRWYAQRINYHTYGEEAGTRKDPFFIAPLGSVFDDKFFNSLQFDFPYNRGEIGNLEGQDDEGPEEGYYKTGDTVVVKFCSITRDNYLYIRSMENQASTQGSPFAAPGNLPFNITGGIGIWAGYAPIYDTIICE